MSASESVKRTDPLLPLQQLPHILQEKGRPAENHGFDNSFKLESATALTVSGETIGDEIPVSLCLIAAV